MINRHDQHWSSRRASLRHQFTCICIPCCIIAPHYRRVYGSDIEQLLAVESLWRARRPPTSLDLDTILGAVDGAAAAAEDGAAANGNKQAAQNGSAGEKWGRLGGARLGGGVQV